MHSQRVNEIKQAESEMASQKNYSSNPLSQFQSHFSNFLYQYPVEQKQEIHETINSEESLPSQLESQQIQQSQQYVRSARQESSINQRIESADNSISNPLQQQVQITQHQYKQPRSSDGSHTFVPFQPQQPIQKVEKSFDMISGITNLSQRKNGHSASKSHTFYYDRIGNQNSDILPPAIISPVKFILWESILPLLSVLAIFIINFFIQNSINDYCFIKDSFCPCATFGVKLWSWFRQLVLFKLGLLCYRKVVLYRVAMGSNNLKHKIPFTECLLLFGITIGIDFILVIWIWNNQDYIFVILVYVVGIVTLFNTFRIRDWGKVFQKGRAIFSYDVCMIAILCYSFYLIPNIETSLTNRQGSRDGALLFIYIYPLVDLAMETFMDWILSQIHFAELFIYQSGGKIYVSIRILCLTSVTTFEFWYLIIVLNILRANNSSMFLTVFLRRWIHYKLPERLQWITKMSETPKALKGKHGAYFEHQFWIVIFYFFYLTSSNVPFYAKSTTFISDCQFTNNNWDQVIAWYQPIIVWFLLFIGDFLGVQLNINLKYDNIKLLGSTSLNFIENVLVRLTGYYLFQMAVMVPFLIEELNDITKDNKHSTKISSEQF